MKEKMAILNPKIILNKKHEILWTKGPKTLRFNFYFRFWKDKIKDKSSRQERQERQTNQLRFKFFVAKQKCS
jgi:hypothetical protein